MDMVSSETEYKACREIIEYLLKNPTTDRRIINRYKNKISAKYHLNKIPTNATVLSHATEEEYEILRPMLQKRPVRTISGVAIVAVMTKPFPCPHGRCVYCPGGPQQGVPQSYTGYEPATMRGLQNEFDPRKQVENRLRQLSEIGHNIEKTELIIMGGTFPATPRKYQEWFVTECLNGMTGKNATTIEEAQKYAETSKIRNVAITIETRPDYSKQKHIDFMLHLGATRVEIGVQSVYEEQLLLVKRGHTVKDTIEATRLLKDSGLKVTYHIMPGLPGYTYEKDLEMFKIIFSNPDFMPDMMKIYPTLVIKGTELYDMWMRGEYEPYTNEEIVNLITDAFQYFPKWLRIQRMQRDIPAYKIDAGPNKGNLRELIFSNLAKRGRKCHTLRCREIGHKIIRGEIPVQDEKPILRVTEYDASHGIEYFMEYVFESIDGVIGYLRLRDPSELSQRKEIANYDSMIIRELKVVGESIPIGKHDMKGWQHKGIGRKLIEHAEEIAIQKGKEKMLIMSAIGTREYYRKFGYKRDGPYMSKHLR